MQQVASRGARGNDSQQERNTRASVESGTRDECASELTEYFPALFNRRNRAVSSPVKLTSHSWTNHLLCVPSSPVDSGWTVVKWRPSIFVERLGRLPPACCCHRDVAQVLAFGGPEDHSKGISLPCPTHLVPQALLAESAAPHVRALCGDVGLLPTPDPSHHSSALARPPGNRSA